MVLVLKGVFIRSKWIRLKLDQRFSGIVQSIRLRDDAICSRGRGQRNQDTGVERQIVPAGAVAEGMPVFTQVLMPLPLDALYGDRANGGDGPDELYCGARCQG